jgi:hypothetical protein
MANNNFSHVALLLLFNNFLFQALQKQTVTRAIKERMVSTVLYCTVRHTVREL